MNSDNRTLAIGQWQSSNTMGYEGFSEFQINSGNLELIGETNTNGDVFTISLGSYTHDASDWHHIVLTQGTDNVVHAYRNGILREDCTELANTWTVNVFGTGYIDANGSLNASTPGTTDFAEIR